MGEVSKAIQISSKPSGSLSSTLSLLKLLSKFQLINIHLFLNGKARMFFIQDHPSVFYKPTCPVRVVTCQSSRRICPHKGMAGEPVSSKSKCWSSLKRICHKNILVFISHSKFKKKQPEELRRYAPTKVLPYWRLTFHFLSFYNLHFTFKPMD